MTAASDSRFVALVPAAGQGTRFGGELPKQYQPVNGRPLISYTIEALLHEAWIESVHIVISGNDQIGPADPDLKALTERNPDRLFWHPVGGPSRHESVSAGLRAMGCAEDCWVMVHDAARPGVSARCLNALRTSILAGAPGALLAMPIADTVKRAVRFGDSSVVESTVDRSNLWLAQTPQVFRCGQLRDALLRTDAVTDESSAMEQMGVQAELVRGDWRNQKITTPADIEQWLAGAANRKSNNE